MLAFTFIQKLFSNPKFEIINTNQEFYFLLKSKRGEVILTSEHYKNKAGALKGIELVKKNSLVESNFEIRISGDGLKYFVLKSGNRKVIGISELFQSIEDVKMAIKNVQSISENTKISFV